MSIGKIEVEYRVNSAYNAFAVSKKLLTNKKVKLHTRIQFLNSLVRSRLVYGCHAWIPTNQELTKIDSTYRYMLRSMLYNGHTRVNPPPVIGNDSDTSDEEEPVEEEQYDYRYVLNNEEIHNITNTKPITEYYQQQQADWISHIIRRDNQNLCKILTFHSIESRRIGRRTKSILQRAIDASCLSTSQFLRKSFLKMNR